MRPEQNNGESLARELNIQELMEEYIMPNDFNTDLLEPQELSGAEQQRILQQTLSRANVAPARAERRGLPRRRLLVFTLAAVMLLVMSSLAVAEFALKQDFLGFFNADEGQLPRQSGQEINMQASDNGATLTVEQVLGDSQTVYVLLDFVAPEGVVLDKEFYQWDKAYVTPSKSHGCGYHFDVLPDDDPSDNRIRMIMNLNADTSLKGQQLDLRLGDLKSYNVEDMDYTNVVQGEWRLNFTLNYDVASTLVPQGLDIQLGEAVVHLNSLEVSPFTMILDIDVENAEGFEPLEGYVEPEGSSVEIWDDGTEIMHSYAENPPEIKLSDMLSKLEYFVVTLKDGTVLDTLGGGSSSDKNHTQIIFEFNRILNLDELASINYLGYELKLQ